MSGFLCIFLSPRQRWTTLINIYDRFLCDRYRQQMMHVLLLETWTGTML